MSIEPHSGGKRMSTALVTAIYNRLAGVETLAGDAATAQSDLAALLATDPDTSKPCVWQASMSDVKAANKTPLYPAITFRQTGGTPDNRFQLATGAVDVVLVDFEIWDNTQSGTRIPNIEDAIQRLLDMRRGIAPVPSLDSGKCWHSQAFTPLQVVYDPNIHARFGLVRYQFLEVRY